MGRLTGRVVMITGASSGIGAACARAFTAEGSRVILAARRADRLDAVAADLGNDVLTVPTDVTDERQVENLFDRAVERFGTVDVLVNNAGIADASPTHELSLDRWRQVLETNLTSAFLCSRAAIPIMRRQQRGRIINIGSLSARVPRADSAAYTASKFGLDGLTRSMAVDNREHGIAVSIFHPGMVVTELAAGMDQAPAELMSDAADSAAVIVHMASAPDNVNFYEALTVPLKVPFLGRG